MYELVQLFYHIIRIGKEGRKLRNRLTTLEYSVCFSIDISLMMYDLSSWCLVFLRGEFQEHFPLDPTFYGKQEFN